MRTYVPRTVPTSAGLLLLDAEFNPLFVNRAAAQILSFPLSPETLKDSERFLAKKIQSVLVADSPSCNRSFPSEFRSGRRIYHCRSFQADSKSTERGRPVVAVLLERRISSAISLRQVSERFHLTIREQKVLELLLEGLTSKEIAARMQISPNTVKAFLRLVMIKMGVSTRSAVIGKALTEGP